MRSNPITEKMSSNGDLFTATTKLVEHFPPLSLPTALKPRLL